MVPQNVLDPCPWPQAHQGTLLPSPLSWDVLAAGCGEGFGTGGSCGFSQALRGKRDSAGESLNISPSFKHFFSKLKQSISEAFTASLETGQSKISQLICLYIPVEPLCLYVKCANKTSLLVLFSLYLITLPSLCRQTHFHQKVGSFLQRHYMSPSIHLLPHFRGEDFHSKTQQGIWEVDAPKGSKCCPAFHSVHLLL